MFDVCPLRQSPAKSIVRKAVDIRNYGKEERYEKIYKRRSCFPRGTGYSICIREKG